jgi:hypothetical protein
MGLDPFFTSIQSELERAYNVPLRVVHQDTRVWIVPRLQRQHTLPRISRMAMDYRTRR